MPEVAFATWSRLPEMHDDDRRAADALRAKDLSVVSAVWDDPHIDWRRFGCVVIRSTWNYHHRQQHYREWLGRCAAGGVNLWNPPAAVIANMNKRYLCDLASRGVDVVPTEYLERAHGLSLRTVLERRGWDQAVVKPAISASAFGTWRTSLDTAGADQRRFEEDSRNQDTLVQPHIAEIATQGEWSLIFFGGCFSHAALKRPAAGDFRVQEELGGSSVPSTPSGRVIDAARDILSLESSPLLYARVDGVERAGRFMLMELEINEPYLFIGYSSGAADRFADAIEAVL